MLDLTLLDQILHRTRHMLDRHVGINPVLIQQVDDVDLQPLQRCLSDLADVLGPAVHADRPSRLGIEPPAELGGDHHLVAKRRERLADQRFVRERAIDLCGVEEGYSAFDRPADEIDSLLLVEGVAITKVDPHASEADRGHFEPAFSKLALLHRCFSILLRSFRAPGSNVTLALRTRAGSGASNNGSARTVPVKYSASPFPEG